MLINYLIFFFIFFIGCQNNKIDLYINKSNEFRIQKDYAKAIIELKNAEKLFKDNKKMDEVNFLLGEIYLNDIKDYNYAIDEFKKIREKSDLYAKAVFMVGYIYSNNLNEYSKAIQYYEIFINNFPSHELYPSVNYELDQLSIHKNIIDSLNTIANSRKGEWYKYE